MKKTFTYLLMTLAISCVGLEGSLENLEALGDSKKHIALPEHFSFKGLYKNDHTLIFKTDEILFAQGKFSKKFSLRTPYGKLISVARIYELTPHNKPLLVVRNHQGNVLGYVHLENYRRMQLFKRVTGIVYDKNGCEILQVEYPLASKHFNISYFSDTGKCLLATTKGGKEGDFSVYFHADYKMLNLDPVFLLTLLQIHASKSLYVSLADYLAIDEIHIDELGFYAQETDGEKLFKGLEIKNELVIETEETTQWRSLKNKLNVDNPTLFISEEEKETIALSLAQRFENSEDILIETLQRALPIFTEKEKTVLADMIEQRLPNLSI